MGNLRDRRLARREVDATERPPIPASFSASSVDRRVNRAYSTSSSESSTSSGSSFSNRRGNGTISGYNSQTSFEGDGDVTLKVGVASGDEPVGALHVDVSQPAPANRG